VSRYAKRSADAPDRPRAAATSVHEQVQPGRSCRPTVGTSTYQVPSTGRLLIRLAWAAVPLGICRLSDPVSTISTRPAIVTTTEWPPHL